MSYDNAVPKPLKFLISDGKMVDDEGNVISESDTLKELYTKWNPEVKKYLLSDGSVGYNEKFIVQSVEDISGSKIDVDGDWFIRSPSNDINLI